MEEIKSINTQKPATKNQITHNKPDIIKNANVLQGYLGNSLNGGHVKTIAYAPIMAGTKIMEYRIRANLKLLTPLVPAYQKLKGHLMCFFVPNSRVWDNAEKFTSQKGGASEEKIKEIPNIGGRTLDMVPNENTTFEYVNYFDTDLFRDSWASSYIPRFQSGRTGNSIGAETPKYSILPLRGFKAIYNDYLRNKEYDMEIVEYKGDSVTGTEIESIFACQGPYIPFEELVIRGKRQNSYYTDYRTELLGEELDYPTETSDAQFMIALGEWQKKVSELRSESELSQYNDWDIIAKIRGSKRLTEGKVQLLGTKTFGINYQAVTQDTYNINPEITKEYQTLGQQGAYSYTEIDIPLFQMQEFIEEGYIHVLLQVTADSVFETGFERTSLNVGAMDIYRPDLKELKHDVLYEIEKCGTRLSTDELYKVTGFKRKFSEYFKAPNVIAGDMTSNLYWKTKEYKENTNILTEETRLETQSAYQFFEMDDKETPDYKPKKIWKDYTDILLNENQAVMNQVDEIKDQQNNTTGLWVRGQTKYS